MRVPLSWLSDYVALEMPVESLVERLDMSTAVVAAVERRGVPDEDGNLGLFRVGKVLEAAKHPNADRLQLCIVDVGESEPHQIVCGAWNFGTGATVAVALPGATLPGGLVLERRKLRGEESAGMILSERELELGPDHTGIIVLEDGSSPGAPLGDLSRSRMWFSTSRSRATDRTCSPSTGLPARSPRSSGSTSLRRLAATRSRSATSPSTSRSRTSRVVPRYIGRLFRDVTIGASPLWLRARLDAAGMRPISNVVDVTNYVMLGLGNPLHAFDQRTLSGGRIVVRRARMGEKLTTLDGVERELDPSDLMIADAERSVALAGIMGGAETEISEGTTEVLLEAANFEPAGLWRTSERLRLRTEGSNRWEKGVDPYLAEPAGAWATELLVGLTGARFVGHTDAQAGLPERPVVRFRPERASAFIGLDVAAEEQDDVLIRLGNERRDWRVRRSHLARSRPHQGGRPRGGSRALPPRRGPVHASHSP